MLGDLQVVGFGAVLPRRIAASTTRFYAGEPLHRTDTTLSSGAATNNVWVPAAADTPVIGTHMFGGVAKKGPLPQPTGTVVACTVDAICPQGNTGLLRGKAENFTSADTDAELLLIINDSVLIDYNATGGVGSTPLYTIKETASADTSGLTIVNGNPAKGTLDTTVDIRCYRIDIS